MLSACIEDHTGDMDITIFGRATQALIKKPCSTLTIDEGFTDPFTIPPIINQLRNETKIFQIYFQRRGSQITAIVSKIFEETELITVPPQISTPATSTRR